VVTKIVWVPGTSNKADEMTRVPESILKMVADTFVEMGCGETVVNRVLAMKMLNAEVQSPIEGSANRRLEAAGLTEVNLSLNDDVCVDPLSGVHRVDPERVMAELLCPERDTRVGQTSGAVGATDADEGKWP